MSQRQTVIYSAETAHDAHFLKNLLANEQIKAVVVNASLEVGSVAPFGGWSTSVRVVVAEEDAPRAREIALEFDREKAASAASPMAEDPLPEAAATVLDAWPRCPRCDAPRSTRCPICGTAGSDFLPADMGFQWIPDLDDTAYRAPVCHCGPGGCTSAGDRAASGDGAAVPGADPSHSDAPAELLMCPTCDEPFPPQYPRLCEWCGHQFADGFALEFPPEPVEQINSRVIAVIIGLLAFVVALVVYLTLIVY